jgi:hypothetical protein
MAELTPVVNAPPPVNLADLPQAPAEEIVCAFGDHPTANPDGVANSTVDYAPKTQEEKAALVGVSFATVLRIAPNEPYPVGDPNPVEPPVEPA